MGCQKKFIPAAQRLGMLPDSLGWRLRNGWSEERAVTEPKRTKKLRKSPETWKLRRIEYGPAGFICQCRGTEFVYEPKPFSVRPSYRPEWRCLKCDITYIFVQRW